jgi:peptidoglycan/LPS O-acetylase OafA/YrhL
VIAYGAYLFHDPLRWAFVRSARQMLGQHEPVWMWAGAAGCLAITILLASVSWDYFESAMVARGKHHRYVPDAAPGCAEESSV